MDRRYPSPYRLYSDKMGSLATNKNVTFSFLSFFFLLLFSQFSSFPFFFCFPFPVSLFLSRLFFYFIHGLLPSFFPSYLKSSLFSFFLFLHRFRLFLIAFISFFFSPHSSLNPFSSLILFSFLYFFPFKKNFFFFAYFCLFLVFFLFLLLFFPFFSLFSRVFLIHFFLSFFLSFYSQKPYILHTHTHTCTFQK